MRAMLAAVLVLAGLFATVPAAARVFTGIPWGGSGDPVDPRRLDVHAPESPGPHPMVVLADVEDGELLARALAERGHVVALLAPGTVDAPQAFAQALAFVFWRGGGYGGDSKRLHVVAGGSAAPALIAVAADPSPLRNGGLPEDALHAVAVVDWRGDAILPAGREDALVPALLAIASSGDGRAAQAAARLAEQWRERGAHAEWVVATGGRALVEGRSDALLRWLQVAGLLRAPRFESLRFAREVEPLPDGVRAAALAVDGDALLLAGEGAAITVWRRDAPDEAWRREWEAAAGRVLWFGAPGQGLAPALLVERDGDRVLHRRDGGRWDAGLRVGRGRVPARAAWVLALGGRDGRVDGLLVAVDASSESRLARVRADGTIGLESVPNAERITGLVDHDGTPMLAVLGPRDGRLLRRVGGQAGAWITAAAWDATRGALLGLSSLAPEEAAVSGVLAGGEAVRIDPARGEVRVEADLARALERQWGAPVPAILPWPASAIALRHPHAGDRVQLLGLGLADPREPPRLGWYVVRQAGGYFAYGRAGEPGGIDGGRLRQLVPSPHVADAGGVFYALDADDPPALRRASLGTPRVPAGAWEDRAQPGRGVVLERTRGGWIVLLHRIEVDGSPRWYSAGGPLRGDALVASTGLVRHRREPDGRLAVDTVGTLAIRFGADANSPECAGTPRRGARALAVLEARFGDAVQVDCIEPVRPPDAARPVVDGSGLWMAPDGSWGMAVQSTGAGPEGEERALVFHFDRDGAPRWVRGTGARRGGEAVVSLDRGGAAGRVAYAFRGACGEVAGSASLLLPAAAGEPALVAPETTLLRAAGGICY